MTNSGGGVFLVLALTQCVITGCFTVPDMPRPVELRLCFDVEFFFGDVEVCPTIPLQWKQIEQIRRSRDSDRWRREEWKQREQGKPHSARAVG